MNDRKRKFWGWGFDDQRVPEAEAAMVRESLSKSYGMALSPAAVPPEAGEFNLRAPRIKPPASLARIACDDVHERLVHAYGKSFPDSVRMFQRHVPEPPDAVFYPENASDIADALDWASRESVAVIPFGGGSSVVGGVETSVGDLYRGVVSLDLARMGRVIEIDRASRSARIEAGAFGPALEAQLKPHDLTLRHFPQSFEFSTLGGWIATRSGGHFATLFTHIDDFVQAMDVVTPAGRFATRRLPGSGAGPQPERLMIGSEGTLGVITSADMRLQDAPKFRASAAIRFADFLKGAEAVRALSQSGLHPANCRLIDAQEARGTGAGDGSASVLVLGFESADHPQDHKLARALELVRDHGGQWDPPKAGGHREGAAGAWRDAFLRAPFWREVIVPLGIIVDTFETAITWDRFSNFHANITARMKAVMREATGHEGRITCRFTHVYPDGPAPYFSFQVPGRFADLMTQWRAIKDAANEIVVSEGGTSTHHHAVGRDHRPGYGREAPPLFIAMMQAAKAVSDPAAILNPGVLFDPKTRAVGVTGAMAR